MHDHGIVDEGAPREQLVHNVLDGGMVAIVQELEHGVLDRGNAESVRDIQRVAQTAQCRHTLCTAKAHGQEQGGGEVELRASGQGRDTEPEGRSSNESRDD